MQPENPLSALKDIHLPTAGGWWPPAVGWWIVGVTLIVLLVILIAFAARHWKKGKARRQVIASLKKVNVGQSSSAAIQEMSELIKRFAISEFGREKVSGLYGSDWLEFLSQTGKEKNDFLNGPGKCLEEGPYRRSPQVDIESLRSVLIDWCKTAKEQRR